MSIRRRALTSALKTAHREEVRAASLFQSIAQSVKDAQLHGTFMKFGAQEQGGVATVVGLLESRNVGAAMFLGLTRVKAAIQGRAARLRPWRRVLEDVLDDTERRAKRIAEAASGARLAGDLDAARSLDGLQDTAGEQAAWFRDFLR
jgi:hypothetical protein